MAPHMVSRWAPASEPPTMARGSCQACARSAQSSSDSPMGGRRPGAQAVGHHDVEQGVEGRHARARGPPPRRCGPRRPRSPGRRSRRRSGGPRPRGAAGSRPRRTAPRRRAGVASRDPTAPPCARRAASAKTSRQPGRPSRMAPCSKLSRSCMVWGSVSATTVAPRAAAAVPAASWLQAPSGFMAETPSTFQLTGRSASSDMVGEEVDVLVGEAVEAARHDELDRGALVLRGRPPPAAPSPRGPPPATGRAGRHRRCACAPARSRSRAPPPPSAACSAASMASSPAAWRRHRRHARP